MIHYDYSILHIKSGLQRVPSLKIIINVIYSMNRYGSKGANYDMITYNAAKNNIIVVLT